MRQMQIRQAPRCKGKTSHKYCRKWQLSGSIEQYGALSDVWQLIPAFGGIDFRVFPPICGGVVRKILPPIPAKESAKTPICGG